MTEKMMPYLVLRLVVLLVFAAIVAYHHMWLLVGVAVVFFFLTAFQLWTAWKQTR
ncbi:hypothetical protein ACFPVT_05590 [Corynebacterium choanae]|uniref:Secreted protein n=1 Tax=Corynebacterium choanae TaxID=1862358 RepID=A0A3G6J6H4_9CORY|nr:hypothetical protein [Corynebacterium choanae]AZA13539.1 hypothetical protein CCHOA_05695 [Corynebacterium choanae]